MKTFNFTILCAILSLISCKKQTLDLYSGSNNIYFNNKTISGTHLPNSSGYLSMGYFDPTIKEGYFDIVVASTGPKTTNDRKYNVVVDPASTLLEGRDYDFSEKYFSIRAGQLKDTIRLKIYRSKELSENTLLLKLDLKENENFKTDMYSQAIGSGNSQYLDYYTQFTFSANNIPGTPWFWDPAQSSIASFIIGYLGNFSGKKLKMIVERYDLDIDEVTSTNYAPSTIAILAWGKGMHSYLSEMEALGTPILDEDGLPMKMGVYVQ
ncbi:DUF4843 domain-containing protein [Sphingobacterium ginsenosidimutans]